MKLEMDISYEISKNKNILDWIEKCKRNKLAFKNLLHGNIIVIEDDVIEEIKRIYQRKIDILESIAKQIIKNIRIVFTLCKIRDIIYSRREDINAIVKEKSFQRCVVGLTKTVTQDTSFSYDVKTQLEVNRHNIIKEV